MGGRGCVPLLSNLVLLRSTFVISIFTQSKNNSHSMELEIALQINRIVTRWLILRKMVGGYWNGFLFLKKRQFIRNSIVPRFNFVV